MSKSKSKTSVNKLFNRRTLLVFIGVLLLLQFYPYFIVRNDFSNYTEEEKAYIEHAIETAKTKGSYIGMSVVKVDSFEFQQKGFPISNCPTLCDSYKARLTVFALGIPAPAYVELDKNGDMQVNFPKRSIQIPLPK